MRVYLVESFVGSVEGLLSSMLGMTCTATEATAPSESFVSGVVSLSGDTNGQMAVSFGRDEAERLVGEMLGLEPEEIDEEMLQDGVGEVANIVAGGAKAKLSERGHSILFSLPSIVMGENHRLTLFRGDDAERRKIETEIGSFLLLLWVAPPSVIPSQT